MHFLSLAFVPVAAAYIVPGFPNGFKPDSRSSECYEVSINGTNAKARAHLRWTMDMHFNFLHDTIISAAITNRTTSTPYCEPLAPNDPIDLILVNLEGLEANSSSHRVPYPRQFFIPQEYDEDDRTAGTHLDLAEIMPSSMRPNGSDHYRHGILKGPYFHHFTQGITPNITRPRYLGSYSITTLDPVDGNQEDYKICTAAFSGPLCSDEQNRIVPC